MARILLGGNDKWFDELKSVAYYSESDIEEWIHQHATSIFPHHFVFPFKKEVVSRTTAVKKCPDLAMIRQDFSQWAVVEVEVEGHPLSHVLEQIRVFVDGDYNAPEIAEYAKKQLKKFCGKETSLKRLTNLFSSQRPSIMVIADQHADDWQQELERLDVDFCICEVYKNIVGHYAYRTFGKYPTVPVEAAHCRPIPSMPNLIEVIGDFTFAKLDKGRVVNVIYDQYLTRWSLLAEKGKQYLRFIGSSNPLNPNTTYGLFRDKSHKYFFQKS